MEKVKITHAQVNRMLESVGYAFSKEDGYVFVKNLSFGISVNVRHEKTFIDFSICEKDLKVKIGMHYADVSEKSIKEMENRIERMVAAYY